MTKTETMRRRVRGTSPRLSLPAEREGNLTKLQKKNNTKPITIKKGIVTPNLATGIQKRGATTGPKWKSWIRKLNNPKGNQRKEVREREQTGERGHAKRKQEWKGVAKVSDKESQSAGIGTK